jgi:hypothetical protein
MMTAMSDTMDRLGQSDDDIFVPKYSDEDLEAAVGNQPAVLSDLHLFAADVRDGRRLRHLAGKLIAATVSK